MTETKYDNQMTTEYDTQFQAVAELKWDPWVGKDYHKTRILILGKSAYYNIGKDNKPNNPSRVKEGEEKRTLNRTLVKETIKDNRHKPYISTAKMFFDALAKGPSDANRQACWSSVAFANHAQHLVNGPKGKTRNHKDATTAFKRVVDILKPELVIIWSTQVWKFGLSCKGIKKYEKIGNAIPRVIKAENGKLAYVGIRHPSRGFNPPSWYEFLVKEPASKAAIAKLKAHLQTVLK